MGTPLGFQAPADATAERPAKQIIQESRANELVFGLVGPAGAGPSEIGRQLEERLGSEKLSDHNFEVYLIKARDAINEWAVANNREGAPVPGEGASLDQTVLLQKWGDEMREQHTETTVPDHAAVARKLVAKIREVRARRLGQKLVGKEAVKPDGKPRAFIVDSLRHPAEVNLLRAIYGDSFILIGVVCEPDVRQLRLAGKFTGASPEQIEEFTTRDEHDAGRKHGQHVGDAFHLADFFIDNTQDRTIAGETNKAWRVADELSRLIRILVHSRIERPTIAETAMHHAVSAKVRSACLSRQVGAAVVDASGNVVATGTNEVPRAGGGVYGELHAGDENKIDDRCALRSGDKFCSNTRQQNAIIEELFSKVTHLRELNNAERQEAINEIRRTGVGDLLEFSRAVHAEMDAILSAARQGVPLKGAGLYVTTFPCHYCARHIVSAGIDEVQYVEPYRKSQALKLHSDSICIQRDTDWRAPSRGGTKVLFHQFAGVAPRFYRRAFEKDRDLKNDSSGLMQIGEPDWGNPWDRSKISYPELEAALIGG